MAGSPPQRPVNTAEIIEKALALGFSGAGVLSRDALDSEMGERLSAFIEAGRHADMGWMAERIAWRADPRALWPEMRSIVMLSDAYTPAHDPLAWLEARASGLISSYALHDDYHDVVKKRLKELGRWLMKEMGGEIKVFVDTAPVMEKPLGQKAGLGWQGKHSNLVSRQQGSWFFLGALFTTVDLMPSEPEVDHCGSCRRCLDICPTAAFPAPYQLDARRCISYLTIEYGGKIPVELRKPLGNRIYGCDDCLAVCPWNKFAQASANMRYQAREELCLPTLVSLLALDDAGFRALFRKSPVKRIGWSRFMRNLLYAAGNSADPSLRAHVAPFLCSEDEVLRDAAAWALAELNEVERTPVR